MEKTYHPAPLVIWLQAIRPKTLTAAVVPFLAGTALAISTGAQVNLGLLAFALASALCIQIATNLINDTFDYYKGADCYERLGPKRAIQQGLATGPQVYALGLLFFMAAFLLAIPLIIQGGLLFATIISASILAGYLYTGGPYPLAYVGLGDIFVVIFFGWVATMAGYWLQVKAINMESFLLGTQIGLLGTLMITINNLRDIFTDTKAGKRTLAVRFGPTFAKIEILFLGTLPFILNIFWLRSDYLLAGTLPFLAFPLAALLFVKIWKTPPSKKYNAYMALAALLHLSFGALISLGLLLK